MNRKLRVIFGLLSLGLILISISCNDDEDLGRDPEFITTDVDLFWEFFDSHPNPTAGEVQNRYIDEGTAGLKDYAEQKNLALGLSQVLGNNAYQAYYREIKGNTLDLADVKEPIEEAMEELTLIYDDTKLRDIYFIIGSLSAGGKISESGLLIAVEMFSKNTETNLSGLSEWNQSVIREKAYLPSIVIHELIHVQQEIYQGRNDTPSLLEHAMFEGMCDYVAHQLLPDEPFMNEHLHAYGDSIESQIWKEFEIEMNKNFNSTEWLYSGSTTSKGHPADMGYYVGYKILEAYTAKLGDRDQAINNMLSATDYYDILVVSEYADKFD